jgi:hypothetical protein
MTDLMMGGMLCTLAQEDMRGHGARPEHKPQWLSDGCQDDV